MFLIMFLTFLMIGRARGGHECVQILSFQQTNFSTHNHASVESTCPYHVQPPLQEILDTQLFIVFTFFFSNYHRVYNAHNDENCQSQVLDRYVADQCSQRRKTMRQTRGWGCHIHLMFCLEIDCIHEAV